MQRVIRPGAVRVSLSPHRVAPAAVFHPRGPNIAMRLRVQYARVYYASRSYPARVEGADLFFSRGRPLLVRTWEMKDGDRIPKECIELDPAKLKPSSSNGTIYRYEGEVRP
jgi:hypothetical protein